MGVKENIRKIIDADPDLTVRNVSLAAGLSDSALHKFLTKPEQSMSVANLEKVADVLGVRTAELFNEVSGLSDSDFERMIFAALQEVPPGTPLSGYPRIVASSLRDQLRLLLKHGGYRDSSDALSAPDTGVQPPAPTRKGEREGRHTP